MRTEADRADRVTRAPSGPARQDGAQGMSAGPDGREEAGDLGAEVLDCRDSAPAASSTCATAEPVSSEAAATPVMLPVTSSVPAAACETLRTISCVAVPCSSTAAAMRAATESISRIRAVIVPMAETA